MNDAEEMWDSAVREAERMISKRSEIPCTISDWVDFIDNYWKFSSREDKLLAVAIIFEQGRQDAIDQLKETST